MKLISWTYPQVRLSMIRLITELCLMDLRVYKDISFMDNIMVGESVSTGKGYGCDKLCKGRKPQPPFTPDIEGSHIIKSLSHVHFIQDSDQQMRATRHLLFGRVEATASGHLKNKSGITTS